MNFVLDNGRTKRRMSLTTLFAVLVSFFVVAPTFAQSQSQVGGESQDFRSKKSGRWVDVGTWQVFRSGQWIDADVAVGLPDANRNVFIETNHTIIATRANVQNAGAGRDYRGQQQEAYVEVNNLHINTAASITTTFGSLLGGFLAPTYPNPNVVFDQVSGEPVVFLTGANNRPNYFDATGTAYGANWDYYDGDRFGGAVNGTGAPVLGATLTNAAANLNPDWATFVGGLHDATNQGFNGRVIDLGAGQGVDPTTGGFLPRPRNNELRVYGKLRYYTGAASDLSDRNANIQVTAATIGTGSTIVFRGGSRAITVAEEWSTTLATRTGHFENSAFSTNHRDGILNASVEGKLQRDNYRGLMGRNSFWTAIFDLGRLRDRARPDDLFQNLNDFPDGVQGVIRGNFTAGIIQIRRGVLRVEAAAFLADEGAATSGSIQVMNNAVLRVGATQIGRTAVNRAQAFAASAYANTTLAPWGYPGFPAGTAAPANAVDPVVGSVVAASNGLPTIGSGAFTGASVLDNQGGVNVVLNPNEIVGAGGRNSSGFPMTPSGAYIVTSRMRYFVVEEGGALDFSGAVGLERPNVLNPNINNLSFGATLSAADVRFNGTVIYSRTGDQTLVGDSPYLFLNPAGTDNAGSSYSFVVTAGAPGVGTYTGNIGENGLYDPYNNLRGPNGAIETNVVPPFYQGVGAARVFAPSTTAAYSHLTLRGSGNKYLLATTVTISRSVLLQGAARMRLNPFVLFFHETGVGNGTQPTGQELSLLAAGFAVSRATNFPPIVYLRSTGVAGFTEVGNLGTRVRRNLADGNIAPFGTAGFPAVLNDTRYVNPTFREDITDVPMWSAYGGNTDPVGFVGFTTASTSIVPLVGDMPYPIGMVLSASTNREQMDMTPWNKPFVVHGLPTEPTYVGAGQNSAQHGPGARGLQYAQQSLLGARFGQVVRQSIDRVNGSNNNNPMFGPVTTGENLVAAVTNQIGSAANFPMITNSLYDYAINSTATLTLQYDSEASDVMTAVEQQPGVFGPHNMVINVPAGVTQILPVRTHNLQPPTQGLNQPIGAVAPRGVYGPGRVIFGVTAGTIILGPEYTNSTNGNLPRHSFNPTTGLYQANAIYNQGEVGAAFTPGVAASAYVDTRPDVADQSKVYRFGPSQDTYLDPFGLRPENALTLTQDGRVRVGFPRQYVQTAIANLSMLPYYTAANRNGVQQSPLHLPSNAINDFGRRGDFNNFGVLELRRGTLEIPSNAIEAQAFPTGIAPNTQEARIFGYTFTLSSTAIMSGDQAKVTHRGRIVGAGNADNAFVCLSDSPLGGDRGPVGLYDAFGQPLNSDGRTVDATPGVQGGTTNGGGAILRGPAGPANLYGTLKGGSLSSMIFTGGTSGTIAHQAVINARTQGYRPPTYGASDNINSGRTEFAAGQFDPSTGTGNPTAETSFAIGVTSLSPAYTGTEGAIGTLSGGGSAVYNAGPEMTSDVDYAAAALQTDGLLDAVSARMPDASVGTNNQSGNNQGEHIRLFGGGAGSVLRANNAYNIDLPRVVGGVNHITFIRATTNVMTLLGNDDNSRFAPSNLTTAMPEMAGLQVYGTIATARGDIDLNGRNIELSGNRSFLREAFSKADFVDTLIGLPLWSAAQQSMPRNFTSRIGQITLTGSPAAGSAFPTMPSSVRNTHRNVRGYIGLTSHRNLAFMNAPGGVTETREDVAGLGAMIYATGNPVQLRVRRWQTRGNDLNGNIRIRSTTAADRYWQIETTGTLSATMVRSELRLQYIDTDLFNENGKSLGLPPVALNIFRTAGQRSLTDPIFAADPQLRNFQALAAQERIGLNDFKFEKQLTLSFTGKAVRPAAQGTQVVAGRTVLEVANFTQWSDTRPNDPSNQGNEQSGFQIWAISIPSPACIVIRGQRFGGTFGDQIGGPGTGLAGDAGGALPANGGPANGGVQAATATLYGTTVGPFKAGIPTVATIVADILDDFGQVASTEFSTGATLVVDPAEGPRRGFAPHRISSNINTANVQRGVSARAGQGGILNAQGVQRGGRLEWSGVQIDGVHTTTLSLSVINTFGDSSMAVPDAFALRGSCSGNAVFTSVQGGRPYQVTFATLSNGAASVPGRVIGLPSRMGANDGPSQPGAVPNIQVGIPVDFNRQFITETFGQAITVIVRDRFGNLASIPTTATIALGGGQPPVNPVTTPLVNQIVQSQVQWGLGFNGVEVAPGTDITLATPPIARLLSDLPAGTASGINANPQLNDASLQSIVVNGTRTTTRPEIHHPQVGRHTAIFPGFAVWGATSNNVQLVVLINSDGSGSPAVTGPGALGNTVATVNVIAGPAIGIAPLPIADPANPALMVRVPTQMFLGRPSPCFYARAVDQFGNTVSGDPITGAGSYDGGVATITFPRVGEQTLSPSNSAARTAPAVRLFEARSGNTAQAVRGVYTFCNFIPERPASDPLEVTMIFSDPALPGTDNTNPRQPFQPGQFPPPFQPIPSVTTASTTWIAVPRLSVVATDAAGGAVVNLNNLALIERAWTITGDKGQGFFSSGSLAIRRPAGATVYPAVVAYTLAYRDSSGRVDLPTIGGTEIGLPVPLPMGFVATPPLPAPVPVQINTLRGDLNPTIAGPTGPVQVAVANRQAPNSIQIDQGSVENKIRFTARYSDQTYSPRSAGIQGRRTVTITLLPGDERSPSGVYEIGDTTGIVTLDDPPRVAPVILNAIQDKQLTRTQSDLIELETPGVRADGLPNTVFYDDNYDPIIYSVASSDPTVLTVSTRQNDDRFGGRPSLTYATQPNAALGSSAEVTVFANDGRGGLGIDRFRVTIVSGVTRTGTTSVAVDPASVNLSVAPNPVTERFTVEGIAKNSGKVVIKLVNNLGATVASFEQSVNAGQAYRQEVNAMNLAQGAYQVVITDGDIFTNKTVQVVK
jgi:hypothetical protein